MTGIDNLRVLFRGTKTIGKYDPATITRWAKVFARAGRQPVIQTLQVEWASRRLFYCLDERVDGPWRVRDFGRGDVFSDALYFALWTNNPNACRKHFRQAVRQARTVTGEADPKNWPPGLFPLLWEHVARSSSFGTWPRRTAQIVEMVPVGRVGRNRAYQELASRGWRLDALRRGAGSGGRLWRREVKPRVPPKPKTARPAAPKAVAPTPRARRAAKGSE